MLKSQTNPSQLAFWNEPSSSLKEIPSLKPKASRERKKNACDLWEPECVRWVPQGTIYCEPYAFWRSLFLFLPPFPVETYNDLDESMAALFLALQDEEQTLSLKTTFWSGFFCQENLDTWYRKSQEMTFLSEEEKLSVFLFHLFLRYLHPESIGSRIGALLAHKNPWLAYLTFFEVLSWRLCSTQIDQRPPDQVIAYWDKPETVFFLSPPPLSSPYWQYVRLHQKTPKEHIAQLPQFLAERQGAITLLTEEKERYSDLLSFGWTCFPLESLPSFFIFLNPKSAHLLR